MYILIFKKEIIHKILYSISYLMLIIFPHAIKHSLIGSPFLFYHNLRIHSYIAAYLGYSQFLILLVRVK